MSRAPSRIFLYAWVIALHWQPQGLVLWDKSHELLSYKTVQLSMCQWWTLVAKLVQRATAKLHNELLFGLVAGASLPTAAVLDDNRQDNILGNNFTHNPRNEPHLAPWKNWLLAHVGVHPATALLTLPLPTLSSTTTPTDEPAWSIKGLEIYIGRVKAFLQDMMVLVHLTGGLPARASKLCSTLQCNSEQMRTLLLAETHAVLLTQYHKLMWAVGGRAVARFLPAAVGDFLVQYVTIVLPLIAILHHTLCKL